MTLDEFLPPLDAYAFTGVAPVGPAQRRRDAVAGARGELATGDGSASEPAIATRGYGPGHLVVALAGTFDRAATERLRGTLRDLGKVASVELVLELSGLASCDPALARSLAQLRVQRLVHGTRVELHDPPAELTTAMGHCPAQTFAVHDDPTVGDRIRRGESVPDPTAPIATPVVGLWMQES